MKIYPIVFLVVFLLIVYLAFNTAKPDACFLVKPPTTPPQLLENINCAVALNKILDDDFFSNDKKLWEIFGGEQISRPYTYHEENDAVSVSFFPRSIDDTRLNPDDKRSNYLEITFSKGNVKKPQPGFGTRIALNGMTGLQLSFNDIQKIFGMNGTPASDQELMSIMSTNHDITPRPPRTNEHGYKIIYYILKAPPEYQATARIEFDGAGMAQSMVITSKRGM